MKNAETSTEPKIAVAMGATFLGFATHWGYLRRLLEAGIAPHSVAGSSAGAVAAALYAAGLSTAEMDAAVMRRDLKELFFEPEMAWRAPATLLGRPGMPAVLTGKRLRAMLMELLGERRIEDCTRARLSLAVTNLRTSAVEIRTTGPLVDTVLASCALPGFLAPRVIDGELLWDGGLGCSVPVEQWIDDPEVTHIFAHTVVHEEQMQGRTTPERLNFPTAMLAGHQITADELLRWKLELARRTGKQVFTVETLTPRPRLGLPLTLPARVPWPEQARALMTAGATSAAQTIAWLNAQPA